jgi:type I restriction enzyme, S subunit
MTSESPPGVQGTFPWKPCRLGDLGAWQSGGTPNKSKREYWSGSVPWVSPKDMKTPYLEDAIDHISQTAVDDGARLVPTNAILVVVRGMILAHTFPVAITRRPLAFNQDMRALVPSQDCDPHYLLFWLQDQSPAILKLVDESTHGTKRLPIEALQNLPIKLPPLEEQRAIAAILLSTDETIRSTKAVVGQLRVVKEALTDELMKDGSRHGGEKPRPVRLGDVLADRKEPGIDGLPVASVTMSGGVVNRADLERRVESALTPSQHLLARKGDIVYNTMRMWQGVSGLAAQDCLVSPAYVVCRPLDGLVPEFAAYLLKHPKVIRMLHRRSQGVANDRLRLYFEHLAPIKVNLPSSDTQKRVAKTLGAIDELIRRSADELQALLATRTALSRDLLAGDTPIPPQLLNGSAQVWSERSSA